jgi:hypothetical protein
MIVEKPPQRDTQGHSDNRRVRRLLTVIVSTRGLDFWVGADAFHGHLGARGCPGWRPFPASLGCARAGLRSSRAPARPQTPMDPADPLRPPGPRRHPAHPEDPAAWGPPPHPGEAGKGRQPGQPGAPRCPWKASAPTQKSRLEVETHTVRALLTHRSWEAPTSPLWGGCVRSLHDAFKWPYSGSRGM